MDSEYFPSVNFVSAASNRVSCFCSVQPKNDSSKIKKKLYFALPDPSSGLLGVSEAGAGAGDFGS